METCTIVLLIWVSKLASAVVWLIMLRHGCMQLAFSSYFMLIAILLIISHYSSALQRMTTISACNIISTTLNWDPAVCLCCSIPCSITKWRTFCQQKKLIWSMDTAAKLFDVEFLPLFVVSLCLLLFFSYLSILCSYWLDYCYVSK